MPGVQRSVDDRGDPRLRVGFDDGMFEDGFPSAGVAHDDAEPALLGVDFEDVEVALLVVEQGGFRTGGKRVFGEAEVGSDHGCIFKLVVGMLVCVAFLLLDPWRRPVVADEVDGGRLAHAFAAVVDDREDAGIIPVESDGDRSVALIAGCLVSGAVEVESVVGADFAGRFKVEEFLVIR